MLNLHNMALTPELKQKILADPNFQTLIGGIQKPTPTITPTAISPTLSFRERALQLRGQPAEQPTEPIIEPTKEMGFLERLRLGFGTKEERESRIEPRGFLKGGLKEIPRDIADVIGKSIPLIVSLAGGTAGAIVGGGIPGAVVGGAAGGASGEKLRQRIGELIGVQRVTPKEQRKEVLTEAIAGGIGELGGRLFSKALRLAGRKVIKPIKRLIGEFGRDILRTTTGVPEKAIKQIIKEPALAREGFERGITATTIREEFVKAFSKVKNAASKAFKEGLEEAEKFSIVKADDPLQIKFVKEERLRNLKFNFETVKNNFAKRAEEFGIKFNTAKSKIIKFPLKLEGAAKTSINNAFKRLRSQKTFNPKALQSLAEDLQSLRRFTAADLTKKSTPIVGRTIDDTSKFIREFSFDLGDVRTTFAQIKGILDNSDAIINASKGKFDIKSVRSSISKLTNIFREDNDIYIDALQNLEKASGNKFLSKLAGTEFQKITPGLLRTSLAIGGIGTGAAFVNPAALLLLPIFSPRAVGGFITRKTQSRLLLEQLMKIGINKEILPTSAKILINRIIEGKLSEKIE